MPAILPRMTVEEALDVTRIYSIADQLPPDVPLLRQRPFRAPHHTISHAGLVGGGNWPNPGEISLTHRGVLFLMRKKRLVEEIYLKKIEGAILSSLYVD
jgi:magnesium chelatase family protein